MKPKIMGILNLTPDSFFDGGKYASLDDALKRAEEIFLEGADILDVGAESSRPGATPLPEEEELKRVSGFFRHLRKDYPLQISIDTTKPKIAAFALAHGARLINDISGFRDPAMLKVAAESDAELCVMHMKGRPSTMQISPRYPEGIVEHLLDFFQKKAEEMAGFGIASGRIILDPGIGFGKSVEDNFAIVRELQKLKVLGFPLLVGASRKSFLGKTLQKPPQDLLHATLVMHTVASLNGADILRAHDVSAHKDLARVLSR